MNNSKKNLILPKSESFQMFNQISKHYDLLNHLLSFGIDRRWRRALAKYVILGSQKNVLDLATGTGDVIITLVKELPEIKKAVGVDPAVNMLEIAKRKVKHLGLQNTIELKEGDARHLHFQNNYFENITMAFGIRNISNPIDALREMNRVLTPNGRAIILEFSLPTNIILRSLHLFYLRTIVPLLGGIVSRNMKAYKYLNQTIESFPYGDNFCQFMSASGFSTAKAYPLLFGIATVYVGEK